MNNNFIILTDSCADLPLEFLNDNNVPSIGLNFYIDGKEFVANDVNCLSSHEFYTEIRNGAMPSTSQINAFAYADEFRKHVSQGKSIIYLGFSSGLSGSINSASIAKDMLSVEFRTSDISIIDTKSASLGQGLLVYYAVQLKKNGANKEDIVSWVENNKMKLNHWFMLNDLEHLKKGGRISPTAAALGNLLQIKPVLHMNDEGKLIQVGKTKGKKQALKKLTEILIKKIVNPEEQVIAISHADWHEEALNIKEMILEHVKVKDIIINPIGPVIGCHTGPNMLSIFFLGENRDPNII